MGWGNLRLCFGCGFLTPQKEGDELKAYELEKLAQRVKTFVDDREPTAYMNMGEFTYAKMKACFGILKTMVLGGGEGGEGGDAVSSTSSVRKPTGGGGGGSNNHELEHRVTELEQLVMQRDNEIAIMVKMIRSQKGGKLPESLLLRQTQQIGSSNQNEGDKRPARGSGNKPAPGPPPPPENTFMASFMVDPAVLEDPTKAFEAFKSQYPKNDAIRDNKILLKEKYDAAKALANVVNDARHQIKRLTLQMDKLHKQQAITNEGLTYDGAEQSNSSSNEGDEARLKDQIEQYKLVYKKGFHDLSELKKEIQHVQKMLEMSRLKLQKDFDLWYQRQGKGTLAITESLLHGGGRAEPKSDVSDAQLMTSKMTSKSSGSTNQSLEIKPTPQPTKSASPPRPERSPNSTTRLVGSMDKSLSIEFKKLPSSTLRSSTSLSATSSTIRFV
jgi:kinesin family member 6/9